jgi:hypothetical protein
VRQRRRGPTRRPTRGRRTLAVGPSATRLSDPQSRLFPFMNRMHNRRMPFQAATPHTLPDGHVGYVAGRYRNSAYSDIWTDVRRCADRTFTAYAPACSCGWQGRAQPATDVGHLACRRIWTREHLAHVPGDSPVTAVPHLPSGERAPDANSTRLAPPPVTPTAGRMRPHARPTHRDPAPAEPTRRPRPQGRARATSSGSATTEPPRVRWRLGYVPSTVCAERI